MPPITQLPCEIVGLVLKSLDHPRSLCPALLTCRHFYTSFKESQGVQTSIVRQQITPALLPYAVAVAEASSLPPPSTPTLLNELYQTPARLAARISTFPASTVQSMSLTHDAIHTLATDFASKAQDRIPPSPTSTPALSPSEYFRFCRAFYRVELFYTLFRRGDLDDPMQRWFLSRYPPWQNEQLAAVYEYLENSFAQDSLEVFKHDVDFGEVGIDYLTTGADNGFRQDWLATGVTFIYDLKKAKSYDARHKILNRTYLHGDSIISLPGALWDLIGHEEEDDAKRLAEYSDAELQGIPQRHGHQSENQNDDVDPGPYRAWREANSGRWLGDSCMHKPTAWLRKRAYVFWDDDRLRNQPHGFEDDPGDCPEYTDAEYKEMLDSFEERSQIYQQGGTGYWSKGDTSRIVFPWRR